MNDRQAHVLELYNFGNTWTPPAIDIKKTVNAAGDPGESGRCLHIMRTQPYIDSVYIEYDPEGNSVDARRFTFHEGYSWDTES